MAYNNVYRPIIGFIKRSTEKAILLVVTDPEAIVAEESEIENWIPRSQIAKITPTRDAQGNTEVMMSEWIIGQKKLEAFVSKPKSPVPSAPNSTGIMDDDIPF
jgi:hypothetical protein